MEAAYEEGVAAAEEEEDEATVWGAATELEDMAVVEVTIGIGVEETIRVEVDEVTDVVLVEGGCTDEELEETAE